MLIDATNASGDISLVNAAIFGVQQFHVGDFQNNPVTFRNNTVTIIGGQNGIVDLSGAYMMAANADSGGYTSLDSFGNSLTLDARNGKIKTSKRTRLLTSQGSNQTLNLWGASTQWADSSSGPRIAWDVLRVNGFDIMNFVLPQDMVSGDTFLKAKFNDLSSGIFNTLQIDHLPTLNLGEKITLIHSNTDAIASSDDDIDFYINGLKYIVDRSGDSLIDLQLSEDGKELSLVAIADHKTSVTWDGENGHTWGYHAVNFDGDVDGVHVDTFDKGDDVIFGRSLGRDNEIIAIDEGGVEAGRITIQDSYSFVGDQIIAEEVIVEGADTLGLGLLAQGPALKTGSLDLDGAALEIMGLSARSLEEVSGLHQLLIQSDTAITGMEPDKAFGEVAYDFLTATATLENDNKEVWVSTQLTWINSGDSAHGNFTLPEADDQFVLDVPLADQVANDNWDGKTLTKKGEGTLILAGDNQHTGSTIVNEGTLMLGYGGTTGSVLGAVQVNEVATLVLNRSDDVEFNNLIEGTGTLRKQGNNTLTITGDNTFTGTTHIEAGTVLVQSKLLGTLNVQDNTTLQVNGGATLGTVNLNQGATFDVSLHNTINGDLNANEATLVFHRVAEMVDGPAYLTVNGNAQLANSTIVINIDGGVPTIKNGETLTLAEVSGDLSNDDLTTKVIGKQGISTDYTFELVNENGKLVAKQQGKSLNDGAKALSEGIMAGIAGVMQGGELVAGSGMKNAVAQASISAQGFGVMGGSDLRYKTGSHVDVKGVNAVAGIAKKLGSQTTIGVFFEYGNSNYDSYNNFAKGVVAGEGGTDYVGGGILAHHEYSSGWYSEFSARAGRVKTDFKSGDLQNLNHVAAAFDSKSTYFGASLGGGYAMQLGQKSGLDLYGQFIWSRQGSDTVKVATGDVVDFKAVNSERLRLGARFTHALGDSVSAYAGAAGEYELGAKAKARINGMAVEIPDLKGATGVAELGLTIAPVERLSFDVGVKGYAGKREGVSGNVQVKYSF